MKPFIIKNPYTGEKLYVVGVSIHRDIQPVYSKYKPMVPVAHVAGERRITLTCLIPCGGGNREISMDVPSNDTLVMYKNGTVVWEKYKPLTKKQLKFKESKEAKLHAKIIKKTEAEELEEDFRYNDEWE